MNLYGYAGGDPVTYSDPFGMCPYAGADRNTNLGDCPDDERLGAFKTLAGNALGRGFISVIAENGIDVRVHQGPINCGGTAAGGCSDLEHRAMTINGDYGAADLASVVAHETQHFINYRGGNDNLSYVPGSFMTDEIHAYAAGFTMLNSLSAKARAGAAYGPLAAAYRKNPRATLRAVCLATKGSDCP